LNLDARNEVAGSTVTVARLLHSADGTLPENSLTAPTPRDESSRRPIDRSHPRDVPSDRAVPPKLDEAALGGADAIPDTPDIADHGAHVGEERRRTPRGTPGTLAQVSAGKGTSMWLSIAGIVVVLILLAVMFF
jgi:hypothetical protein